MTRQPRRPPPGPVPPTKPSLDLSKMSFDLGRVKLPQIAVIGFVVGILFHACVIFAVLDDGSGGSTAANTVNTGSDTPVQTTTAVPQATPTTSPTGDRTNCNAIRGTEYRSEAERQWFIRNCTGT